MGLHVNELSHKVLKICEVQKELRDAELRGGRWQKDNEDLRQELAGRNGSPVTLSPVTSEQQEQWNENGCPTGATFSTADAPSAESAEEGPDDRRRAREVCPSGATSSAAPVATAPTETVADDRRCAERVSPAEATSPAAPVTAEPARRGPTSVLWSGPIGNITAPSANPVTPKSTSAGVATAAVHLNKNGAGPSSAPPKSRSGDLSPPRTGGPRWAPDSESAGMKQRPLVKNVPPNMPFEVYKSLGRNERRTLKKHPDRKWANGKSGNGSDGDTEACSTTSGPSSGKVSDCKERYDERADKEQ